MGVSVIVPAFNEELMIEKAYFTISDILKSANIDNEIIFIEVIFNEIIFNSIIQ